MTKAKNNKGSPDKVHRLENSERLISVEGDVYQTQDSI